jgi:hypothetical protein
MEPEESYPSEFSTDLRRIAPFIAAVIIAGAGIVFAVREHNNSQAVAAQRQALSDQNKQLTSRLNETQDQLASLNARVAALSTPTEPAATTSTSPAGATLVRRPAAAHRAGAYDSRFKKMQSQLDAQGKLIDAERGDIDSTRSDLSNTRTELTGSIAKTHDELVVLEKKGERNYFEFDITCTCNFLTRTSDFKREGPVSIGLKKADSKHGFADLALVVDDRNLTQKHVNLYQPAMFYEPDTMQPVEIVINEISKNHIHGYVSAPKYRKSELAAASDSTTNPASGPDQAGNNQAANNEQPAPRQKLPLPGNNQPDQQ